MATRALELNGVASGSEGGEDTGSLGGSESDTSRTDGKHHVRVGSVKKPTTFKPVSFTKFSVPKAPGSAPPSKIGDKGSYHLDICPESLLMLQQPYHPRHRARLHSLAQDRVWSRKLLVDYETLHPRHSRRG